MFHSNIRIAVIVCAAIATSATAQPHKGGGGPPAARGAPAAPASCMRRPRRTQLLHRTSPRLPRVSHPLRTLRPRAPRLPHIPRPLRTSLRRSTRRQPPRRGTRKRPGLFHNDLPGPLAARKLGTWRGARGRRLRLRRSRKLAAAMLTAAATRELRNQISGKIWPARADRAALPPRDCPRTAAATPLDNKP